MKNGEYESVEQMDADLTMMFENAKRYNMPNSSIYKRAFRLQQIMQVRTSALFLCQVMLEDVFTPVRPRMKEISRNLKQTMKHLAEIAQ